MSVMVLGGAESTNHNTANSNAAAASNKAANPKTGPSPNSFLINCSVLSNHSILMLELRFNLNAHSNTQPILSQSILDQGKDSSRMRNHLGLNQRFLNAVVRIEYPLQYDINNDGRYLQRQPGASGEHQGMAQGTKAVGHREFPLA